MFGGGFINKVANGDDDGDGGGGGGGGKEEDLRKLFSSLQLEVNSLKTELHREKQKKKGNGNDDEDTSTNNSNNNNVRVCNIYITQQDTNLYSSFRNLLLYLKGINNNNNTNSNNNNHTTMTTFKHKLWFLKNPKQYASFLPAFL